MIQMMGIQTGRRVDDGDRSRLIQFLLQPPQ